MTELLDKAVKVASLLSPDEQDEIARIVMQLAGQESAVAIPLSEDERDAIARSKAAAARGEFATEAEVKAVWSKHGL
jgi:predicted transcriptional regulator